MTTSAVVNPAGCFCVVITCHVLPCAVALVVCKQYFHTSYEHCSYQKKNREMCIYICVCVNVSVYVSMRLYVTFLTVYYKIFGSISIVEKKYRPAVYLPNHKQKAVFQARITIRTKTCLL